MDQDSFDSFDDIEEMVMATNNLSLSPNSASEANRDSLNVSGEEDELPRCIIVTNVDLSVFDNIDIKVGLICQHGISGGGGNILSKNVDVS